jgi:hypothetical protein
MRLSFFTGNINLDEFVEIFVQIYDGEDTGEEKTKYVENEIE